jgi:hypothetical protein
MSNVMINWADLAKVAEVAAAFGIGIVTVFALGVVGMSRAEAAREAPNGSSARLVGLAVAGVAFVLCASAVLYGLYLLIPQFH